MSKDLRDLDDDFRENIESLIEKCDERGVVMRPFFTKRHPVEQAKLWRQSRSSEYIRAKIVWLNGNGAPFLAQCLIEAGPCDGPPVTGALPGESWHQYGLACDLFWLDGRTAIWDPDKYIDGINGYRVMHEVAKNLGLYTVTFDGGKVDWPHVQQPEAGSPRSRYSWSEINDLMEKEFG